MYHADLRQEILFLEARIAYKEGKLAEALRAGDSEESIQLLRQQLKEIQHKLAVCREESQAQDEYLKDNWMEGFREE